MDTTEEARAMYDIAYLALGLAILGMMALYARWTDRA
jgi:hypothetical protein